MADALRWSPTQGAWVRVLSERQLFGRALAEVQVLGTDRVATVTAASLLPERPVDRDAILAVAAAARLWKALGADLLLAPLLTRVIPLPHQFRVLRKAMGRFPVRMLLADEVGMGKTIEAGLLLKELKLRGLVERVLVVAPKSLLLQWQAEMRTLFGEKLELVLPGEGWASRTDNAWRRHAQVITSLDAVKPREHQRGWSQDRIASHNLVRFHDIVCAGWDLVIIDESHKVAGSSEDVARYQLAAELARVVPHLLLLSATPHSGKGDAFRRLLALLDDETFAPGPPLDRAKVEPYVVRSDKRTATDDAGKALFPVRTTKLVTVTLGERHAKQAQLYEEVTRYVVSRHDAEGRPNASRLWLILVQRLVSSSTRAVRRYLEARLRLLQERAAEQVWLEPPEDDAEEDDVERLAAVGLGDAEERQDLQRLVDLCGQVELEGPDARAEVMLQHMRDLIRSDNEPAKKFLVFTEFTATQVMLRDFLETRGFPTAILHGGMDLAERQAAQVAFKGEAQVLIATDAGGEGLNMQFAHVVFNYDLPWAPMRVEQRIGRVDRIGQTREVKAFNLVLENSVEARLYEVWQFKLATILAEFGVDKTGDVLDSGESEAHFERLARAALLRPATFDHEVDRVLTELRRSAEKAQQTRGLFQGEVGREDKPPAVPLRAWLDTLARARQSSLFEEVPADTLPWIVERLQALRPYAPVEHEAPSLVIGGLAFESSGWLTVWRVGIAQGHWRRQRIFALLHTDEGATFAQAGARILDALAARRCTVDVVGEVRADEFAAIERAAEAEAAGQYDSLVDRARATAGERLVAVKNSLRRRREILERLPESAERIERLGDLAVEERAVTDDTDPGQWLPQLECLLLARVRTS